MSKYTHRCSDENCNYIWNDKSIYPTCPSCGEDGIENNVIKYEPGKFIVINTEHIKNASLEKLGDLQLCIVDCFNNPEKGKDKLKNNKYYVCNQDEPYAQKVLDVILEGEKEKRVLGICGNCDEKLFILKTIAAHIADMIKYQGAK